MLLLKSIEGLCLEYSQPFRLVSSPRSTKTLSPKDVRWNPFLEKFSKNEIIDLLYKAKLKPADNVGIILLKEKTPLLQQIIAHTVSNLADYSAPRFKSADLSPRLAYNDKDELIFHFDKYKGAPVKAHIDYAEWMLEKDFPDDTKNILKKNHKK